MTGTKKTRPRYGVFKNVGLEVMGVFWILDLNAFGFLQDWIGLFQGYWILMM